MCVRPHNGQALWTHHPRQIPTQNTSQNCQHPLAATNHQQPGMCCMRWHLLRLLPEHTHTVPGQHTQRTARAHTPLPLQTDSQFSQRGAHMHSQHIDRHTHTPETSGDHGAAGSLVLQLLQHQLGHGGDLCARTQKQSASKQQERGGQTRNFTCTALLSTAESSRLPARREYGHTT